MMLRVPSAILMVGLLAALAHGSEPTSPESAAFFETRVRPVLVENCLKCHGGPMPKGHLRLDSRAGLMTGGDQGPAIVTGNPEESLLILAIRREDKTFLMPPSRALAPAQVADLIRWVAIGAPWPGGDHPASTPRRGEFQITKQDRAHWAFQPIQKPEVPNVRDVSWAKNPIDAFLLAELEAKGLRPNPPAAKHELIRRAFYDLTGLPPSPEEVRAFLDDPSPEAHEAMIDRLLASPRYGEAWGRHWLDLVRFAETNSYERDNPKPNAWRYRDYVIRSWNQDKPYNRFIREQLAGDELPDGDADSLIATGYYRLGIWDDEPTDREQARYDGLDDIVATTAQVFLGLTIDCARCHDHKLDPIRQKDYYRFLAFFQNVNDYHNGGTTDEATLHDAEKALCVTEAGETAPETFVLVRGNAHLRGEKVEPGFLEVLGGSSPTIPTPARGARTTGRRMILADWIASAENPLTARVIANRIWQHHFGRGIVRSPSNFGLQGDRPTNPALLDWLAAEFLAQGWRLKPLHRLIMTSNAYRMSSRSRPDGLAEDPGNELFWRFDSRRLTAEEVRDSILAVSGTLNLKMEGPGIYPEIPPEVLAGQSVPGKGWGRSSPEEQARRSVYIHVKRSLLTPILEGFDLAEPDRSSPVRFSTTQPTQALAMLNGAFLNRGAGALADRLRREAGDDLGAQVRLAFRLATAREPSEAEVRRGLDLIESLRSREGLGTDEARRAFALLVLNLNEFLYLD